MMFQISDVPRLLPELMLAVLALLVLGSDVLERWADDPAARRERGRAAAQLTGIGLGLIWLVTLVQGGLAFTIAPAGAAGPLDALLSLGRNLQAGGAERGALLGAFATDGITVMARLLLIGAALVVALLAGDHLPDAHPAEFFTLLLLATLGMCVMAAAQELIIAFVALECSSIALYVLAGYSARQPAAAEAGMKYLLFGVVSSAVLLYGMSLAYGVAASIGGADGGPPRVNTSFAAIAEAVRVADAAQRGAVMLAVTLMIAGVAYKLALVPFHSWAPDVYQGASPTVAAFLAAASKTAGVFLLVRVLTAAFPDVAGAAGANGFTGWAALLALLALSTLVLGNLAALPQDVTRRLLAYSSISHAGFLALALLPLGGAAPLRDAASAALLYYLVVALIGSLAAFGALAALQAAGVADRLEDLAGLRQRNPLLAAVLTVAIASMAGLPPLAGFTAKFAVFVGAWEAGAAWLVVIALVTTVIALAYYLRVLRPIWMQPADDQPTVSVAPVTAVTLALAALALIALGVLPGPLWQLAQAAVLAR
jgi:NADH-quinone oxidoreductase subunit N